MQRARGILKKAVLFGLSAALFVALSWLLDSNHQTPLALALTQIGATFFWITVIAGAWLYVRNRRR